MIPAVSDTIRAFLALGAGMALFFASCAPLPPKEKRAARAGRPFAAVEEKAPLPAWEEVRRQGDEHLAAGRKEEALAAYENYLQSVPAGQRDPEVLLRVGRMLQEKGRYSEAVEAYRALARDHPAYERVQEAQLGEASCFLSLGEYGQARQKALEWVAAYPGHALSPRVYLLLGRAETALGGRVEAFRWWLRGWKVLALAEEQTILRAQLRERIDGVLQAAGLEQLEAMKPYAAGSDFSPQLLHRLATLYLEQGDLDRAMKTAMALVRATPRQDWVDRGREIMDQVSEARAVRKNAFGCLLPLSGPFSIYGEQVLNGVQLGLLRSDAEGVELVIRDTEGSPQQAVAALEELVNQEKVLAVVGPLVSKAAAAAAERAAELGIPLVTLTQKRDITSMGETVFRNFLTPMAEVERLLDKVRGDMGLRRFAILYPDNAYGRYLMELFWEGLERRGGIVTAVEAYGPDQTDFAEQIKKMIGTFYPRSTWEEERIRDRILPEEEECRIYPDDKPIPVVDFDAVFIPDVAQRVVMITPQLAFHDVLHVQLMGTSLWHSSELLEEAQDYVQHAIFPTGFFADTGDPDTLAFVAAYRDNYDEQPGLLAAAGYDTISVLLQVVAERQGGFRTRKEFAEALRDWPAFHGVTGDFRFGPDGDVIKDPLLLTVHKEKILPYPW